MKFPQLMAALALATTGTTFAADNHAHGHEHKPLYGGLVVEVKDMDYELVAKPELLQLHLSDHGKAVDVTKAAARLTLLSGTEKVEVELQQAGDKLEARGRFKVTPGTKVVAVVSWAGRSTTARFVLK